MIAEEPRLLTGWGRTAPTLGWVTRPAGTGAVAATLASAGGRGVIARGLGRAYGDAAQNAGGRVLDMTALAGIGPLDEATGTITVAAGASLESLISAVVPRGWCPAVLPGTAQVTVGGAIACDAHGKNHHLEGSFSRHVRALELVSPALGPTPVAPGDDAFAATAGGMGLTGVVVAATLALRRIETAFMRVDVERARDLDDVMERMARGDGAYRYSVAWIDCLARGRAILLRGDHAGVEELPASSRADPLRLPPRRTLPAPAWGVVRPATVRALNEVWFRRAPRRRRELQPLGAYFHPLDAVRSWNRLYGPRGLLQYQVLLPFGREAELRTVVERLAAASCLAVLKRFGPGSGWLSFPAPGWTLAVDVPAAHPGLAALLDGLDELVAGAGGRVYLGKDSRLRPELLAAMYPELPRWRDVRARLDPDGVLRSDLGRRLGLA